VTTELEVELVRALPQGHESLRVKVPEGSSVGEALARAAALDFAPAVEADANCLAIFGRAANLGTRLHAGDRIEILRPLLADPKQRRRERAGTRKS
jgi:putative ubiquitin-RnfH superfamily antitoxin RatB of RatAB toxin-antitoxin module